MAIDTVAQAAACGIRFRDLSPALSEECLSLLDAQGFISTTPVQAATIPLFCKNKDVVVEAVTGSGKTLAFVLPVVEILKRLETPLKPYEVGAIVVSPTRELAAQIASVAAPFIGTVPGLTSALLVGGTPVNADISRLAQEGANVLIGTPGRLDDILERATSLDLRQLEVLVLDEADRLLDMGFQAQLSSLMARLPKQRRTGLFSATQTRALIELAAAGMRNPVRVEVQVKAAPAPRLTAPAADGEGAPDRRAASDGGARSSRAERAPGKVPTSLRIQYTVCPAEEKSSQLVRLLAQQRAHKVIVYMMTCACVDFWSTALTALPALKGLSKAREAALAEFAALPCGVLLCTDVAARGLDIPGVDSIIQYDPPQDPKAFVHRAGRTARMGRAGTALVFLTPKLQGVPLEELPREEGVPDVVPQLRKAAMGDRDVMEKGLRAFVSFFRAYKEHHCHYIFRWKELEAGKTAMAMGLLQIPGMPDLKRRANLLVGFEPVVGVNLNAVKYKEKSREKQRQRNLSKASDSTEQHKKEKGASSQTNGLKTKETAPKKAPDASHARGDAKRGHVEDDEDDMEEDYRLLKKVKKGAISEQEFDDALGIGDDKVIEEGPTTSNEERSEGRVDVEEGGNNVVAVGGNIDVHSNIDVHRAPMSNLKKAKKANNYVRNVSINLKGQRLRRTMPKKGLVSSKKRKS
eukprot:jgi/Mesen1/1608/ME000134S00721